MNSSNDAPVLWKDIWWKKGIVLTCIFVALYVCIELVILFTKCFLRFGKRRTENEDCNYHENSSSNTATTPTGNATNAYHKRTSQITPPNVESFDMLPQTNHNNLEFKSDNVKDQFYDLVHHGINFYDDNVPFTSRHRRPRMHSTVTEATLVSMIEQRQRPGTAFLNPPPFPKIDRTNNDDLNANYGSKSIDNSGKQYSAGDMNFCKLENPSLGSLSTGAEQVDGNRPTRIYEKSGSKIENSSPFLKIRRSKDIMRNTEREYFKHQIDENNIKITEANPEDLNIPNTYDASDYNTNMSTNGSTIVMMPCTSLIREKNMNDSVPSRVECSICKTKTQCFCKNCSSFYLSQQQEREFTTETVSHDKNNCEDFSDIQEEFIDDNFEDMESIVSDDVADS